MIKKINVYELKEGITKEQLIQNGFRPGGFNCMIEEPKYFYKDEINSKLDLYIEISEDMKFSDTENVMVYDIPNGEPFISFYQDIDCPYMNMVAELYNAKMDKLVESGILTSKPRENTKKPLTRQKNLK